MQPSIAVVISAGGIKPMAAIPILRMLADEGIRISFLAGSSGGAIVAALEVLLNFVFIVVRQLVVHQQDSVLFYVFAIHNDFLSSSFIESRPAISANRR